MLVMIVGIVIGSLMEKMDWNLVIFIFFVIF